MIVVQQRDPAPGNWRRGQGIPRRVTGVVLHVTEGLASSADAWIRNPAAGVSWHFLVTRAGEIRQYVGIHDIAYHAGRVLSPVWLGLQRGVNPNEYTIGIEHEGSGRTPWTAPQLLASTCLSAWLAHRFLWPVDALHFPLHREIYAAKSCPGVFDRPAYLERVAALRALFGNDVRAFITGIR